MVKKSGSVRSAIFHPIQGIGFSSVYPSIAAIKAKTTWLEKILATRCPDLVGPPEECLGARAGRACCDVPGTVALGPSSVVPLQERRVSESESVRAVIRRVCSDHLWLLRPHTLTDPTYH
jgi:hypothetical protein